MVPGSDNDRHYLKGVRELQSPRVGSSAASRCPPLSSMSFVCFRPLLFRHESRPALLLHRAPPRWCGFYRRPTRSTVRALSGSPDQAYPRPRRWEKVLTTAASLYPLYVTIGGTVACVNPSAFSWFVKRGPASYSFSLGFIMLATGLTLELKDLFALFRQRPFSVGMQNCSLGVVLATSHFSSPLVALPPALSAIIMNIMGSSLGAVWRYWLPCEADNRELTQKNEDDVVI
ncbi:hypothetical protein GW17_00025986 [Ensete ventricosum]|nr:hypothetical protein GW17_00025986 [Ensete ventricosum]